MSPYGYKQTSFSADWESAFSHKRTLALRHVGEFQTYESSSSSAMASEGFLHLTIEPIMLAHLK